MKIKIIAAPGDNRDDFAQVERQANEWLAGFSGKIVSTQTNVALMPDTKASMGKFMMALTILYEGG